jgi:hypothetical protein
MLLPVNERRHESDTRNETARGIDHLLSSTDNSGEQSIGEKIKGMKNIRILMLVR